MFDVYFSCGIIHCERGNPKPLDEIPMDDLIDVLTSLDERLKRIEATIATPSASSVQREWYSVGEAAELLNKAAFTVREWCRLDRINARKRHAGRGNSTEWMISQTEIERILNHGLLPRNLKS